MKIKKKVSFDGIMKILPEMNKYVLEFQILPTYPDVTGLYFDVSVSYLLCFHLLGCPKERKRSGI